MTFTWPLALLLLLVAPAILAAYLWKLRRRRGQAVRYPSVALLRSVVPRHAGWRRHLPVGMLLAGLAAVALASARPHMIRAVPIGRTSIILALDVSGSMCANDVEPNRLAVAQAAARDFVEGQADGTRVGIVVFSGFAQLVVPPTTDLDALTAAIDALTTARGTALGAAILKGIDAVAEVNPGVRPVGDVFPEGISAGGTAAVGGFVPDIVVLLTDGRNTRGIDPLDAVPFAVERGVRVYTIGFGTTDPATLVCSSEQLGGGGGFAGFGGEFGGGGGFGSALVADEDTLRAVAEETGGRYYGAVDAPQLQEVFAELPRDVALQDERQEVTVLLAALGALLAAAAVAASIRWSPYP